MCRAEKKTFKKLCKKNKIEATKKECSSKKITDAVQTPKASFNCFKESNTFSSLSWAGSHSLERRV